MENKEFATERNVNGRVMYKLNEGWKSRKGSAIYSPLKLCPLPRATSS